MQKTVFGKVGAFFREKKQKKNFFFLKKLFFLKNIFYFCTCLQRVLYKK